VARGLSWQGAEFSTDVAVLDTNFRAIYDAAVAFMVELREALDEACQRTKTKKAKRSYWGLHVRFFKELCVAAKVGRDQEVHDEKTEIVRCIAEKRGARQTNKEFRCSSQHELHRNRNIYLMINHLLLLRPFFGRCHALLKCLQLPCRAAWPW